MKQRGSILILSIWILLILSIFAASVGYSARNFINSASRFEIRSELRLIAKSGIEKGIAVLRYDSKNETVTKGGYSAKLWSSNEAEFKDIVMGRGFASVLYHSSDEVIYGIVDEEGKININQTEDLEVFEKLLQNAASLSSERAAEIAAAIFDWKDADEEKVNKQGAESDFYQTMQPKYVTRNAPFDALDELLFVRGVTYEIYDALKPYITTKTEGIINLNAASKPVLVALGMSSLLADKIIQFRAGTDQILRTADDRFFQDIETASERLKQTTGISTEEEQVFAQILADHSFRVSSALFMIRSEARIQRRRERLIVEALVDKQGGIRSWHELFQAL